jgi:ankyrin repeat protein
MDPNTRNTSGSSALIIAITSRKPKVAHVLLEYGADPKATTPAGEPALLLSVPLGPAFVREMLSKGADVNAKGKHGNTSLFAVFPSLPDDVSDQRVYLKSDVETAYLLLRSGADVNARDDRGWTPLMNAVHWRWPTDLIKELIKRGADVNAQDNLRGYSALTMSLEDPSLVKVLIDAGADVNARTRDGLSVLKRAQSFPKAAQLLKAAGAKE